MCQELTNVSMNMKKTVLTLIESIDVLIVWCLSKLAIKSVRPAMIPACENLCRSFLLLHDWICSVSTHVMKGVNIVVAIKSNDKIVACYIIAEETARL